MEHRVEWNHHISLFFPNRNKMQHHSFHYLQHDWTRQSRLLTSHGRLLSTYIYHETPSKHFLRILWTESLVERKIASVGAKKAPLSAWSWSFPGNFGNMLRSEQLNQAAASFTSCSPNSCYPCHIMASERCKFLLLLFFFSYFYFKAFSSFSPALSLHVCKHVLKWNAKEQPNSAIAGATCSFSLIISMGTDAKETELER